MTESTDAAVQDGVTTQDAVSAEVAPAVHKPYSESDTWVPSSLDLIGQVDTTGTGGAAAQSVQQVSPVFAQARAAALGEAVKAVENHPQGNPDSVVLPVDGKSYADALDELKAAAEVAANDPQLTTGQTPGQVEAALEGEPVNPNAPVEPVVDEGADATTEAPADGVDSGTTPPAE